MFVGDELRGVQRAVEFCRHLLSQYRENRPHVQENQVADDLTTRVGHLEQTIRSLWMTIAICVAEPTSGMSSEKQFLSTVWYSWMFCAAANYHHNALLSSPPLVSRCVRQFVDAGGFELALGVLCHRESAWCDDAQLMHLIWNTLAACFGSVYEDDGSSAPLMLIIAYSSRFVMLMLCVQRRVLSLIEAVL